MTEPRISELENVIGFDLETSGLDEQNDQILEVHAKPGRIVNGRFKTHAFGNWSGLTIVLPISTDVRLWHPAVVEMHTRNGLIVEAHNTLADLMTHIRDDCKDEPIEMADMTEIVCGAAVEYADDALAAMFPKLAGGAKWTLLGNTVHFDLRFARRLFPLFAANLSHRVIDVSSIRIFCETLGLPHVKGEPAHRATDDVLDSIRLFERCAEFVKGLQV